MVNGSKFTPDGNDAGQQQPAEMTLDDLLAAPPPAPLTPQEYRRKQINDALVQDAVVHFNTLAPTAETDYSHDLSGLHDRLTRYLKQDPAALSRGVILDPALVDAGLALGLTPSDATRKALALEGVTLGTGMGDTVANDLVSQKAVEPVDSRFGIRIYTTSPTYIPLITDDPKNAAYVIVPGPAHGISGQVPGFTPEQDDDFTNRHESWHARDTRHTAKFPTEVMQKANSYDPAVLVQDATVRAAFLQKNHKEVFADVGALGDMIRAGGGTDAIDKVSAWRMGDSEDPLHQSAPVLQGLKWDIEKMGIDKFRAMDDKAAENFYYSEVEKYGMNDRSLMAAASHHLTGAKFRADFNLVAKGDPDLAKGVVFDTIANLPSANAGPNVLTDAEKPIKEKLGQWDAMKVLQDKAFAQGGKITPATLLKAYGTLQTELHGQMKAAPGDHLIDLKMSKLQTAFVDGVPKIDYVEANAARGVNIAAVEPSLSKFTGPLPEAPTASAAPPQPPKTADAKPFVLKL